MLAAEMNEHEIVWHVMLSCWSAFTLYLLFPAQGEQYMMTIRCVLTITISFSLGHGIP